MKTKYLFSALLGGALLAACSSDDAFDSVSVAQKGNPASPVFIAHLDNNSDTRAEVTSTGKVNFEPGDLLSLYNGVKGADATTEDFKLTNLTTFTGYQNAVYEGSSQGDQFILSTKALVREGGAIMVYPADTADVNLWGTNEPIISIPKNQGPKTKEFTPYISEVLQIDAYDKNKDAGVAGYGKTYDIYFRRIGGTLRLALSRVAEPTLPPSVDPLEITKVELEGVKGIFPYKMEVLPLGNATDVNWGEDHQAWVNKTTAQLRPIGEREVGKDWGHQLSTTDIDESEVATFTMLPYDANAANQETTYTITVSTTYGSVAIKNTVEDVWVNLDNTTTDVLTGLKSTLAVLWGSETNTKSVFYGETVGKQATRTLKVDLTNLDMNNLHIKNEKQLINAVAVFKALPQKNDVNFYLDGDEKDGKFTIETEKGRSAFAAAVSHKDAAGHVLTLTPCTDEGEVCREVVFSSEASVAVPDSLILGGEVDVRLEGGTWTLGKNYYKNVKNVFVSKDATVTFASVVNALDPEQEEEKLLATTDAPILYVEKEGTINVNTVADASYITLQLNVENYGEININGADLRLSGGVEMNNNIVLPKNLAEITSKPYTKDFVDNLHRGKITISGNGSATTVETTNSSINNYGYILLDKSNGGDPSLLLATNGVATEGKSGFDQAISEDNIFGIVDCGAGGFNKGTKVSGVKGFIMSTTEGADKANYIVYNNASKESFDLSKADYIEIKSAAQWATINKSCAGLIVHSGVKLAAEVGNNENTGVSVATYLKGTIYKAGTFIPKQYTGYFGGNADLDKENVLVE